MSRARDIANYGDGIDTSSITSGTFADARIAQSNVTQHESAIDALGTVTSGTFNGTIGSSATFPTGHVIQTVGSFDQTSGTPYAPSTISMVLNNVQASSKVYGVAWTGNYYPGSSGVSYPYGYPYISGGGISSIHFFVMPASSGKFSLHFFDDSPGTGTNTYTLNTALGTSGHWTAAGGYAYGYTVMEIA